MGEKKVRKVVRLKELVGWGRLVMLKELVGVGSEEVGRSEEKGWEEVRLKELVGVGSEEVGRSEEKGWEEVMGLGIGRSNGGVKSLNIVTGRKKSSIF